jgi:tripartite-type tricarboxylate transporter receptor subunit TctC
MCCELFKAMAEVNMVHVPYRASYMPDLLGGQVQAVFSPISQSIVHIQTGALRALAVTTATRQATLPDIPAVAEFVPGYEASGWYGIGAPRNTPGTIIAGISKQISQDLADAKMGAQLADIGAVPMPMGPVEFEKFLAAETEKWGKVIRAANIKLG